MIRNKVFRETLDQIVALVGGKEGITIEECFKILDTLFPDPPFMNYVIREGALIYRTRINEGRYNFKSRLDISYISDPWVLENYVHLGRANLEGEGIFYGTMQYLQMDPEMVAINSAFMEGCKKLSDSNLSFFTR